MSHYFYWDPERILFTVPIIDRPVVWYGLFFVLGFIYAYISVVFLFKKIIVTIPSLKAKIDR